MYEHYIFLRKNISVTVKKYPIIYMNFNLWYICSIFRVYSRWQNNLVNNSFRRKNIAVPFVLIVKTRRTKGGLFHEYRHKKAAPYSHRTHQ